MTEPDYRDGSLWVFTPRGPGEPWLSPGVVQGPPGQQGPRGDEGPEGPPGTARITHLVSAATTIQSQTATPVNGWTVPVEAGRSYHITGRPVVNPSANQGIYVGIGGSAQVSLVRMTIQYNGSGQPAWNNTYQQTVWNFEEGFASLGQGSGRLSIALDAWLVVTVSGTAAIRFRTNVNTPAFSISDGSVLEVISTTAARRGGSKPFGEPVGADDPLWA